MPSLQIGLCGVSVSHPPPLSQLPKVTAQILAQCLKKRRDPLRDRPTRSSPHTRGCVQPTKGTGFPKFSSFPGHVVPHSLQTGVGGLDFMTHIQVCDCFLFYFTAKGSGKDQ